MDASDSNLKRSSTTKRSSKSRKPKKPVDQDTESSAKTSADTTSSTFLMWLGRSLNLLFLILLVVSGAMSSIVIFNDVLHGQVDSVAGDSVNKLVDLAVSDSMRNELPRYREILMRPLVVLTSKLHQATT